MSWHFSGDVAEFRRNAGDHLARDPARCTALLTLSEALSRPGAGAEAPAPGRPPSLFGWWRPGAGAAVGAAFVQVPPHLPQLGPMPGPAARALARALRSEGVPVRAVRGEDESARVFADAWAGGAGGAGGWTATRRMRLFRLGEPVPPHPAPSGRARRATPSDVPLVAAWTRRYAADIGEDPTADHTPDVTRRVAHGGLYVWEDGGRPVSMAARSPLVAGQSRVSVVYTPAELRGRGYAAGVTAAVGRAALHEGARHVLLFTDLANPTSNALYRRLGYRPLADHLAVSFAGDG
ncbi:GNAT family N-acetyltransferase [Streptomyces sp. SP18CS02]|uniref:GNAT family N-acetyltransferase n=1 Tax=Streptomyces sp. SP18CS02 TaxID=3002531 RepID=UPI002E766B9D|nr:GNAT family N-acetyltransferase [Streptomyces sp. SP18CS02]MEE1753252.1 GNAT family N-acetyltransferase [Streptomyces sp. SP18CS02]